MLELHPFLCKLLIRELSDVMEPLRIAALKGLEFLLENLGCTMGDEMVHIL